MRFMIHVKATAETEAGAMPEESMLAKMTDYHEALAQAGVMLDAAGLQPSAKGWRIRYDGDPRLVTEGPLTETKELIAGYTTIRTETREEALEWARRFPNPAGESQPAELEVRQLFEFEDFDKGEAIERFRRLGTL